VCFCIDETNRVSVICTFSETKRKQMIANRDIWIVQHDSFGIDKIEKVNSNKKVKIQE
jgi:hypothetical protein